ncbi:MAG: hypothetical protein AAGN35_24080 [Bacteroidota bacterium]
MKSLTYILLLTLGLGWLGCGSSDGIDSSQKERIEELGQLPRTTFNQGGVSFSIAELPELKMVHPDSVGWASYMAQTEDNGTIGYYFIKGYDLQLASPQIRIEYINKALPDCGSVEELFNWLKGVFVNDERQATVLNEGQTIATTDGQIVELLELRQPQLSLNDSLARSSKTMAYAYIDQGERFVALNFTATEDDAYDEGLPLFKDMILSYRKE